MEISSLMIRLNLQKDYETLEVKLSEATQIAKAVDQLAITSDYENAKEYLSTFMWKDCFHYTLILDKGPEEFLKISSDETLENLTSFLNEMLRLGHDLE